jgi:hypothetical protein
VFSALDGSKDEELASFLAVLKAFLSAIATWQQHLPPGPPEDEQPSQAQDDDAPENEESARGQGAFSSLKEVKRKVAEHHRLAAEVCFTPA